MRYLLDSNVLIDYLDAKLRGDAIDRVINDDLCISVITKIEVLGFMSGVNEFDSTTENFVALSTLYDLTPEVIDKTIEIRKKYKMQMADAIIAATALTHEFTLLSRNTKDFTGIKGLKVIDPYTLK